jgi:hypothetical protein
VIYSCGQTALALPFGYSGCVKNSRHESSPYTVAGLIGANPYVGINKSVSARTRVTIRTHIRVIAVVLRSPTPSVACVVASAVMSYGNVALFSSLGTYSTMSSGQVKLVFVRIAVPALSVKFNAIGITTLQRIRA